MVTISEKRYVSISLRKFWPQPPHLGFNCSIQDKSSVVRNHRTTCMAFVMVTMQREFSLFTFTKVLGNCGIK